MNAAIAAIVVTFQSGSTIDACLSRLRQAQDVAEIRVIDNGSLDGTLEIVQRHASHDPRVRFIGNPDNPGFAAANNQGVADSSSPWLAFINPDLMVEPETLAGLRSRAEALGDCLLGVEQVDEHGHADEAVRRRDPDFLAMLRSPGSGSRLAIARDPAQAMQRVPALSGALLMMPRALFDRIGGWDAGYRLHAEDLDLCRRAREAGAVVAIALNHGQPRAPQPPTLLSGVIEAATLDRLAKGQATGSLQACQAAPAFFMRQPVSASTRTRWGLALGTGSTRLATATFCAPLGRLASHTETGKAEGLESTGSLAVVR